MINIKKWRRWHRILAIIIGIQISFWMISGIYFSWISLDTVHGDDRVKKQPLHILTAQDNLISPSILINHWKDKKIRTITLKNNGKIFIYEVNFWGKSTKALHNAFDGSSLKPISSSEAMIIAKNDFDGDSISANIIKIEANPPNEYRGPLPVFQVNINDSRETRIYISPIDGKILAHRNRFWRVFDFLWMLHILDFDERDDINNNWLKILSILGFAVVISGYVLYFAINQRKPKKTKIKTTD